MKTRSTDRASARLCRPRQCEVGRIGINDMAALIGDDDAIKGAVGHFTDDWVVGRPIGKLHDPGGERECHEQPDHGQQREQAEDIGLGLDAAEQHEADRSSDHGERDEKHQRRAAAAAGRSRRLGHLALRHLVRDRHRHSGRNRSVRTRVLAGQRRTPRMSRKSTPSTLIGGGYRFSDKDMRKSWTPSLPELHQTAQESGRKVLRIISIFPHLVGMS